ncbi:MAG TPA: type II toxin-antitoxin system VapC family toxin [Allosphingosinicella sp.]
MPLLLDTNIVVAIINGSTASLPVSLSGRLAGDDALYVSVVSLWELAIKSRLGKIELSIDLENIPTQLGIGGVTLLDLTAEHAIAEALPVPETRDPFDRLLLAIAHVEHALLLTTDRALAAHPLAWAPAAG